MCFPDFQVVKGKEEISFFSLPEFEEWKLATPNWMTWKAKYYKGLKNRARLYLVYVYDGFFFSRYPFTHLLLILRFGYQHLKGGQGILL